MMLIKKIGEQLILDLLVDAIKDGWKFLNDYEITIPILQVILIVLLITTSFREKSRD